MLHSNLWYDEQFLVNVARAGEGEGIVYIYAIPCSGFPEPHAAMLSR
jgi:hypothetical protein